MKHLLTILLLSIAFSTQAQVVKPRSTTKSTTGSYIIHDSTILALKKLEAIVNVQGKQIDSLKNELVKRSVPADSVNKWIANEITKQLDVSPLPRPIPDTVAIYNLRLHVDSINKRQSDSLFLIANRTANWTGDLKKVRDSVTIHTVDITKLKEGLVTVDKNQKASDERRSVKDSEVDSEILDIKKFIDDLIERLKALTTGL